MKLKQPKKKIKSKTTEAAEEILNSLKYQRERKVNVEFLHTGSTNLNLAISNTIEGGWPRARVINLVADGSAGKSLLAIEGCFQYLRTIKTIQSKIFPKVKNAKVVYNNGEGVMDFPIELMYGKKFNELVNWRRSPNIEAAGRDYLKEANALKKGDSLFYVMDSWDSFKSSANVDLENSTDEEVIKAYQFAKQIYAWKFFAKVCDFIDENKTDATLMVISQTRSKIGVKFGKKKYRTGGDALNFYTHLVPWLREVKRIDKTRFGEKRVYSIQSEAKIERTKVGLPFRTAQFYILFDHGIDDIRTMGAYLQSKKYKEWRGISLKDLHAFSIEVEKQGLYHKLQKKVGNLWHRVENAFREELEQRIPKRL